VLLGVGQAIRSFLLESQPGLTYRILSASAMGDTPPPAWTPLCTNTTASGLVSLLITNGLAPYQFYRAVTP
jgi:hypothetical protein